MWISPDLKKVWVSFNIIYNGFCPFKRMVSTFKRIVCNERLILQVQWASLNEVKVMGKVVGVWMNKLELERLQELGKELGLENETAIIKTALSHLANQGESNPEIVVNVPSVERIRLMVKESLKEVRKEAEIEAKRRAEQKAKDERWDRIGTSLMRIAGFKD